ncbi:MAG: TetR/AcrR family transcriptional regulator [Tateyamaria sp.]|nr:TetR/AcrR family transcriptional regulator [Tateyamaria sp.]
MARTIGSHSGKTGPRVRDAAMHLFAQRGFAAVSMRQIASEVGVQVGALYNYFPDKQTLLFELMRDHMLELLSAIHDKPETTPSSRLEVFVRFHITFHHQRPDAVFIAYMELRNLSPQNFEEIEALRRRYETVLEDILRAGLEANEFQVADTKITTLAIIAMLTGVSAWFRSKGRLSIADIKNQYWEMVQKSVFPKY